MICTNTIVCIYIQYYVVSHNIYICIYLCIIYKQYQDTKQSYFDSTNHAKIQKEFHKLQELNIQKSPNNSNMQSRFKNKR